LNEKETESRVNMYPSICAFSNEGY